MKIISWNVNGIRSNIVDSYNAQYKKPRSIAPGSPLMSLIENHNPDVICFQETRLGEDLYCLFESKEIKAYYPYQYWSSSKKEKGRSGNRYSGTSIWCKEQPIQVLYDAPGLNDEEGRFIQVDFPTITIITTYTPNTGSNWDYRLSHWEPIINAYLSKLSKLDKPVVYCGDNNIAMKNDIWFGDMLEERFKREKDEKERKRLAIKIKSKEKIHTGEAILCGYSKQERDLFTELLRDCNMVDCYRAKYRECVNEFSWFNIRIKNSFENNIGWRIDRFLLQKRYSEKIRDCTILSEIGVRTTSGTFISDHLPIILDISL